MTRTTIRSEDITAGQVKAADLDSSAVDTTPLEDDIAILGFKVAANGSLSKYNLADQTIDAFEDASGIDAGGSTNESRDATGKYYVGGSTTPSNATGGTITTDGGKTIHTFNSSGTFTVPGGSASVEYLVVAGGGGGGGDFGGGGGAGGYRSSVSGEASGGGASAETPLTMTIGAKTVTVGLGGVGSQSSSSTGGASGADSVFDTITSTGGGGGEGGSVVASVGGSGGGAKQGASGAAGTSNQGYAGGDGQGGSARYAGGGGGGASAVGATGTNGSPPNGGNGGAGISSSITGSSVARGGGGGGFVGHEVDGGAGTLGTGGSGGGGDGGRNNKNNSTALAPTDGAVNTGGGGGGASNRAVDYPGGDGGSGVVIARYTTNAFDTIVYSDMTLVSNATTAEAAPTKGDIVMTYTNGAGTATVNTDIKGWISRDDGTTYTQATLASQGTTGGHTILTAHDLDISSQPSGTAMRYKITTHNQSASLETRIQAVSLGWS